MSMDKRRCWTAQEKMRIVLAGLDGGIEVSELCRREGTSPTQFYGWKKQLVDGASRVFDASESKASAREQKLQAELTRSRHVIFEITAENLYLKKGRSG